MDKPRARRNLATNLRIIRLLRQWSQEDLAAATGLDRSYVSGLERAERNVSLDVLEKVSSALGVSIADLTNEPDTRALCDRLLDVIAKTVDGTPFRVRDDNAIYAVMA